VHGYTDLEKKIYREGDYEKKSPWPATKFNYFSLSHWPIFLQNINEIQRELSQIPYEKKNRWINRLKEKIYREGDYEKNPWSVTKFSQFFFKPACPPTKCHWSFRENFWGYRTKKNRWINRHREKIYREGDYEKILDQRQNLIKYRLFNGRPLNKISMILKEKFRRYCNKR